MERTGFHVVFKPSSMILAPLAAVGYLILMQQYALTTFTLTKLIVAVVIGLAMGVLLPTLATLIPHKRKPTPAEPMQQPGEAP